MRKSGSQIYSEDIGRKAQEARLIHMYICVELGIVINSHIIFIKTLSLSL